MTDEERAEIVAVLTLLNTANRDLVDGYPLVAHQSVQAAMVRLATLSGGPLLFPYQPRGPAED